MRTLRGCWAFLLAALICLLPSQPAFAGGLAPDLLSDLNSTTLSLLQTRRVIVRKNGSSLTSTLLWLLYGARVVRNLPLANQAVVTIPLINVSALARDAGVRWVSPDHPIYRFGDSGVQAIGADQVWSTTGQQGSGISVAVLDTGINAAHVDLGGSTGSRLVAWQDFVNGTPTPYDDDGHGTHVAGCVLGNGTASSGAETGTAPQANLVAVKVLQAGGAGNDSDVIAGIDWCIQNAATYNIRVINLSLGRKPGESTTTDPLCDACRRAVQAGIVVVASAGNKGQNSSGQTAYGGIGCPGNEPAVITVGATNSHNTATRTDDTVCGFSSRGPTYLDQWAKPDLVAPGNQVVSLRAPGSLIDTNYPQNQVGTDYFLLSGTSFSAPRVAGVAALMLGVNPGLQPNTVKGLLQFTAEHLNLGLSAGLDCITQGAGALNAPGAVQLASLLNPSVAVGGTWTTQPIYPYSTIGGYTFGWSNGLFWGTDYRSGADLFNYRQQAWSDQVSWGSTANWYGSYSQQSNGVAADQAYWSNQVIWDDPNIWPDHATWGEDKTMILGESATSGGVGTD